MTIIIVIGAVLCISLGFYGGYRFGSFLIARENATLRNQLMLQERFSRIWALEAADKYNLSQQVAQSQTTQVNHTLTTVVNLLNSVKIEQAPNIGKSEQTVIQKVIDDIKGISTNSEFEP